MTLVWRPGFMFDADASNYIEAVEAADEAASPGIGALETNVRYAINDFVLNCKADGYWPAIKASCILAGARTRLGALVPLIGTAPDSFNFVNGDYDRKTGLVGDGATKYLDSKRAGNADPQDNRHIALYANLSNNGNRCLMGVRATATNQGGTEIRHTSVTYCNPSTDISATTAIPSLGLNFLGYSRSTSSFYESRRNGSNSTISMTSGATVSTNILIYTRTDLAIVSNARITFYSIGEALSLTLLDARVTDLIAAFGRAIP